MPQVAAEDMQRSIAETDRLAAARRAEEVRNDDLMLADAAPEMILGIVRSGELGQVNSPCDRLDALVMAARQEPTGRALKLLLELPCAGWPPEALIQGRHNGTGNPILHVPCYRGFPRAVACLLSKGAKMDALDRDGTDALYFVLRGTANDVSVGSEADFLTILRFFQSRKWDVTHTVYQNVRTPSLHLACERGSVAMATLLLDAGADVNAREAVPCDLKDEVMQGVKCLGGTPLHKAVRSGELELVNLLLQRGADTRLRQHGSHKRLPVEGCISGTGGNLRVAAAIFAWEEEHGIQTDSVGPMGEEDEAGRPGVHVSDHNVRTLRELLRESVNQG